MALKPIPRAPNLEYYRKQAKALLKAIRSGDPASLDRVHAHLPRFTVDSPFLLSDAQWIVAREHGHVSWPKFKRYLETIPAPDSAATATELYGSRMVESEQIGPTLIDKETPMNDTQTVEITKPQPPHTPKAPQPPKMPHLPIGDESVRARTGKNWEEWFAIFDARGCQSMSHQEIVAIAREHAAGSWWQQMVTVCYEQARGLRSKNQSCFGDHRVNVSKTLNAPIEAVFNAWNDNEQRWAWLPDSPLTIRKAAFPKSLRITLDGGANLDVNLFPKGDSKCSCGAEHSKLGSPEEVEKYRAYWRAAMERLKQYVES